MCMLYLLNIPVIFDIGVSHQYFHVSVAVYMR